MSAYDYLRHRPFLVVELFSRPGDGVRTERKGWRKSVGNIKVIDYPRVVNRISDTTMRRATVIIDLQHDKVIKNRYKCDGTAFDDEILVTYMSRYADVIEHAKLKASLA